MFCSVRYLFLVFLTFWLEIWVFAQDSPTNQAYLFAADAETFLYQDLKTTFSCQGTAYVFSNYHSGYELVKPGTPSAVGLIDFMEPMNFTYRTHANNGSGI